MPVSFAAGIIVGSKRKKKKKRTAHPAPRASQAEDRGINTPFDVLADFRIEEEPGAAPLRPVPEEESGKTGPDADRDGETDLFTRAMSGVAPLKGNCVVPAGPGCVPLILSEADEVLKSLDELVGGRVPFDIADGDEYIQACVRGLDGRVVKKLKKGEFAVQAYLDLHGMRREEAKSALDDFLTESHSRGLRCVLIIHGRGYGSKDQIPVLKEKMHAWLTRRAASRMVLAYTTARPYDGGAGAVYVLLRK